MSKSLDLHKYTTNKINENVENLNNNNKKETKI